MILPFILLLLVLYFTLFFATALSLPGAFSEQRGLPSREVIWKRECTTKLTEP